MPRECDCGERLDENDECPACRADWERMNREYGWGNVRAAMEPVSRVWRSREDLLRDFTPED